MLNCFLLCCCLFVFGSLLLLFRCGVFGHTVSRGARKDLLFLPYTMEMAKKGDLCAEIIDHEHLVAAVETHAGRARAYLWARRTMHAGKGGGNGLGLAQRV